MTRTQRACSDDLGLCDYGPAPFRRHKLLLLVTRRILENAQVGHLSSFWSSILATERPHPDA